MTQETSIPGQLTRNNLLEHQIPPSPVPMHIQTEKPAQLHNKEVEQVYWRGLTSDGAEKT